MKIPFLIPTAIVCVLFPASSLLADEKRGPGKSPRKVPTPGVGGGASEAVKQPVAPPASSPDLPPTPAPARAPTASLDPEDLAEFPALPARVQVLIAAALELTKRNLTYTFGSADPANGGMDCSGTIFHLLASQGIREVPRDSSGQYQWVRRSGLFFAVVSRSETSFEFSDLQPGDLMFWTGTYGVEREIPISHVMLYLGTEKKGRKRVMFGASDGRSYNGIQRWGVSVFDFKMPRTDPANPEKANVDFVGYGPIPGLRDTPVAVDRPHGETPALSGASPRKPSAAKKPAKRE